MQVDGDFAAILGVFSSILSAAVSYGVLKGKIEGLEKDTEKIADKFVTTQHFYAVIEPIKNALQELAEDFRLSSSSMAKIQEDIKEMLHIVKQERKHS